MKETLDKIQDLRIRTSSVRRKFIENVSALFPNLKCFGIRNQQEECKWIACKYPKLETFRISTFSKADEIIPFLQMNPKIRNFAINTMCLLNNRESIKTSKFVTACNDGKFRLFAQLNKRLKIYGWSFYLPKKIAELNPLPALIKLDIQRDESDYTNIYVNSKRFEISSFHNL